ncbi:DUF1281 family ferredoxin-like fold protein [Sinomicrobium oceani]|uniref:DUF1281 family ferredoxin-like fold protein n=1 Tax=Sinomicrobium oceani TaxID=1150368 RepID=UPI00227A693B|nr:hypothetical protein [Sinomicrobium oceani]
MANSCYNSISITGNETELDTLHRLLTKEKDNIDFEHVLKRDIPFEKLNDVVGTSWFTPDITFQDKVLKLIGHSAWSPPVPLFESLAKTYPSLHITMDFEELGMCFGGRLEIDHKGTSIIFQGNYWQYMAFLDYESFLQEATLELQCRIETSEMTTVSQLGQMRLYQCVAEPDRPKLLKRLLELTGMGLYAVTFEQNPHIEERIFATCPEDIREQAPNALVKRVELQ